MANNITIRLEGFDALLLALRRQPVLARKLLSQVVERSTFNVVTRARGLVPVDTGDLLHAIDSSTRGLNGRVGITESRASGSQSPGVYWKFVEFGTVHQAARPFFRPAAEAEATPFIEAVRSIGPKLERDFS